MGMETVITYIEGIGFVGLLVILAIPKIRKWAGFSNGNGSKEVLKALEEIKENHLHDLGERMTKIETQLAIVMKHLKL